MTDKATDASRLFIQVMPLDEVNLTVAGRRVCAKAGASGGGVVVLNQVIGQLDDFCRAAATLVKWLVRCMQMISVKFPDPLWVGVTKEVDGLILITDNDERSIAGGKGT